MHQSGHKLIRIAEALGRSPSWVNGTLKRFGQGGLKALEGKKPPGAKPKISGAEVSMLLVELEKGAEAHGFSGSVWTRKRVGAIIFKLFGQSYDPSQIGRILFKAGWSQQKPQVKARQQDAEQVRQWRQERLPALKKKRRQKDA
jgi:transposase